MHSADRGTAHAEAQAPQPLANLRRAPLGIALLQRDDLVLERARQLVGVPVRPATAIGQPTQPPLFVPVIDLVAGLPRDPELGAQGRHGLALSQAGDKSETLVFHVTLLPRHAPSL